jgi:DNA-binding GntR family transcriptional regulator
VTQAKQRKVVRAGTTVEQMVRAIADMIVTGELLPGERLDELSLAARFEVSRTPVREALRELGAMNLVGREPNRSAVVMNVTQARLHSMFEAMAELEGICARLSASRMTVDERRGLDIEHRSSIQLVHSGSPEDYSAYNTEFHNRLYRGAHNDHLLELATQTRARLVTAILRADCTAAGQAAFDHVSIVSDASAVFVAARG